MAYRYAMIHNLLMTTTATTQDLVNVIPDALGSSYSAKLWTSKDGQERAYITDGRKQVGYITIRNGALDLSNVKLSSAAHGKAEGWILAELVKVTQ